MRIKQSKFFFIVGLLFFAEMTRCENRYIVAVYRRAFVADGPYDTIQKQYMQMQLFLLDSANYNKLKQYSKGKNFTDFFIVNKFFNPDSVKSVELYYPPNDKYNHIRADMDAGRYTKNNGLNRSAIPYFIYSSVTKPLHADYAVAAFEIEYKDSVFFKDTQCFDENFTRQGFRRRQTYLLPCPEFYYDLSRLKPKLVWISDADFVD